MPIGTNNAHVDDACGMWRHISAIQTPIKSHRLLVSRFVTYPLLDSRLASKFAISLLQLRVFFKKKLLQLRRFASLSSLGCLVAVSVWVVSDRDIGSFFPD
jgi:hypothetical protein